MLEAARQLPTGKKVFILYTAANQDEKYGSDVKAIAEQKNSVYLGTFGCKGYNTFGPLKLIGGMNKENPTPEEIKEAIAFYEEILGGCERVL